MTGRRILVTGSRDWADYGTIKHALFEHVRTGDVLVHGDCPRGADEMAARLWQRFHGVTEAWPADWDAHGRAAGPIRNQEMVRAGANLCLAFIRNQSPGAMDCMWRAKGAGIPTVVYRREDA